MEATVGRGLKSCYCLWREQIVNLIAFQFGIWITVAPARVILTAMALTETVSHERTIHIVKHDELFDVSKTRSRRSE